MRSHLLTAKYTVPSSRPGAVERPCLIQRLNSGRTSFLTLVCTPAGYGKTTLLCSWCRRVEKSVAWLNLETGDNDFVGFFLYLIAALRCIDPSIGRNAVDNLDAFCATPTLGENAFGDPTAVMDEIVKDMKRVAKPAILVLDDYHVIHNPLIHQIIRQLLEARLAGLQIVVSTRKEPAELVGKDRFRQGVTVLYESDLRFDLPETHQFFTTTMGLHLDKPHVSVLNARAEGWVTGLQLAALSLRGCENKRAFIDAFDGSNKHVMDYLVDEVLAHQHPTIRSFLLRTSILDVLSSEACHALVFDLEEMLPCEDILQSLEAENVFVFAVADGVFRFHHLFAGALRYRLEQHSPELAMEMHRRAAAWFDSKGRGVEAVRHSLAVGDHELTAQLAEQYGFALIVRGNIDTFLGWIDKLSSKAIFDRPYLTICTAWALELTGAIEQALYYAAKAEENLAAYKPVCLRHEERVIEQGALKGYLAAVRAYCSRIKRNPKEVLGFADQAMTLLPEGDIKGREMVAYTLGLYHLNNGRASEANAAFEQACEDGRPNLDGTYAAVGAYGFLCDEMESRGDSEHAIACYLQCIAQGTHPEASRPCLSAAAGYRGLAYIFFQRNELDRAKENIETSIDHYRRDRNHEQLCLSLLLDARITLALGDPLETRTLVETADDLVENHDVGFRGRKDWLGWVVARTKICLDLDDIRQAEECLTAGELRIAHITRKLVRNKDSWMNLEKFLLAARILFARGNYAKAYTLCSWIKAAAELNSYKAIALKTTVVQAAIKGLEKNSAAASEHLAEALALARTTRYLRLFLLGGHGTAAMAGLLKEIVGQDASTGFSAKVLAFVSRKVRGDKQAGCAADSRFPSGPVTVRDIQILGLLARGLTSPQIALELKLSVHTVRSYIKEIYRKIGAHSRIDAVNKAEKFGLLS